MIFGIFPDFGIAVDPVSKGAGVAPEAPVTRVAGVHRGPFRAGCRHPLQRLRLLLGLSFVPRRGSTMEH